MKNKKNYNYLEQHISQVQAEGKLCFSLRDLEKEFPNQSEAAIKLSLNRLSKKNKIVSVFRGFYLIIPPEYQVRKILPAELFIDALFKYLGRPYYLGLLSAAAFHGASHQQAMETYVFINKPPIRDTKVEGLKINYVVKSDMAKHGIEQRKTDTGYISMSNVELTAVDLIDYQKRIGGLNRAVTVLYELSDAMDSQRMINVLENNFSLTTLQRLGYLLDIVLGKKELAEVIKNYLKNKKTFRVPLKQGFKKNGFDVHPVWKVIENYKIETDFPLRGALPK